MKTQNQVILEDLQKFLEENGVESLVLLKSDTWVLTRTDGYGEVGYNFSVFNGYIGVKFETFRSIEIVPLADPEYKEKFLKYLSAKYREKILSHILCQ